MCYDEGVLQEYIDREIPGRKRWEIEAHIAVCEKCKSRLADLEEANKIAAARLSAMSHEIDVGETTAGQAWVRLTQDERFGAPADTKGVFEMAQSRMRKVLIPAAAVAAIAISLSFAPVRGLAADFLNIFRVEKIETITITGADIQQMQKLGDPKGGVADIESLGKIETTGMKKPATVTLDAAQKAVDFTVKAPKGIDGYALKSTELQYGSNMSFTLDVDNANELIKSFGGKKTLPAELDGKKFTAKMPTSVVMSYREVGADTPIMVAQTRSPEMILPEGVDPLVVREVLLGLPILPDNIKKQLEAIQDWKHTLIIPSIEGSTQEVTVNGTQGVFMQPPKEAKEAMEARKAEFEKAHGGALKGMPSGAAMNSTALIWQQDGVIYAINGDLDLTEAQAIASLMK